MLASLKKTLILNRSVIIPFITMFSQRLLTYYELVRLPKRDAKRNIRHITITSIGH